MKRVGPLLTATLLTGCIAVSPTPAFNPSAAPDPGVPPAAPASSSDATPAAGRADPATETASPATTNADRLAADAPEESAGLATTNAGGLVADIPAAVSADLAAEEAALASPRGERIIATLPAPDAAPGDLAWSPDGTKLAYVGPEHRLMLLDLSAPASPREVAGDPASRPIFTPDGQAVVYVGGGPSRPGGTTDWRPATLYLQDLDGGDPVDLLPGDLAVQSVSTVKMPHRWLDGDTLAYEEHVGTAAQRLFMLSVNSGTLTGEPDLTATTFHWSPDGGRVAGQWHAGPPFGFWVWDRQAGHLRNPAQAWEIFEAWSPDGRELLYTEWNCATPYCPEDASILWRLDLETGDRQQVAEKAGPAAWSANGQIAYIQLGESLELVVTDAATGRQLWTEPLGPRAGAVEGYGWDLFRPRFEGGYLAFRNVQGDWFAAEVDAGTVHHIYHGQAAHPVWSPGGRHLAILDGGRVLIIENQARAE